MKKKKNHKTPRAIARALRNGQNPIPQKLPAIFHLRRRNGTTKGAFGGPEKRQRRLAAIAASQTQGVEISRKHALDTAFRKFYHSLSPKDRASARASGIHKQSCDNRQRIKDRQNGLEFCDPADLPDSVGTGSHNGRKLVNAGDHPIDHIEPEHVAVDIDGLSRDEVAATTETFSDILRWSLDDNDVVQRGERSLVMIHKLRPDLAAGVVLDDKILWNFQGTFVHVALQSLEDCGAVFGKYLEWINRGKLMSDFGQRLEMTAYLLRPDLLERNTLAKMGAILNKTRQSKDKLANCARDTFSGLKALAMRPEITRDRCQQAQLS